MERINKTFKEEDEDGTQGEAEITDPYDPYVPNDLLQYRERRLLEEERLQAQVDAQRALEQQKVLREQLEQERQDLQRTGDLSKLVAIGRGRGRGLSNLPAWLVAKQQQEKESLGPQ